MIYQHIKRNLPYLLSNFSADSVLNFIHWILHVSSSLVLPRKGFWSGEVYFPEFAPYTTHLQKMLEECFAPTPHPITFYVSIRRISSERQWRMTLDVDFRMTLCLPTGLCVHCLCVQVWWDFSTNTWRTQTISTTFCPEASSGREKGPCPYLMKPPGKTLWKLSVFFLYLY